MGCFDTYSFICPWCEKETTDQVKPGYMNYYKFGDSTIQDMEMCGEYTCEQCGKNFEVEMETLPRVFIKKVE